jgi:hypothetical protein
MRARTIFGNPCPTTYTGTVELAPRKMKDLGVTASASRLHAQSGVCSDSPFFAADFSNLLLARKQGPEQGPTSGRSIHATGRGTQKRSGCGE